MIKKIPVLFLVILFVLVSLSCSNPISDYFSTRTAVMQTATATMWTPTPTFTPTNTPPNTPTFTPTFTPTPDFLYADDFEDPDSGWTIDEDSIVLFEYTDGGYRIKVKEAGYYVWTLGPEGDSYDDFRLEFDATKLGGPKRTQFGAIVRYEDRNNFYLFLVSTDGEAQARMKKNGSYSTLVNWTNADGVTADGVNHVEIVCNGNDMELSVNGELAVSVSDKSFNRGEFGLVVATDDIGGSDVLFDNLFIRPV
jgi:hypothetical protein